MIKLIKDLLFGEPSVSLTIISLVLTAWLAALTQTDLEVPVWLAIASPASIALSGFYVARQKLNGTPPDDDDGRGITETRPPDPS